MGQEKEVEMRKGINFWAGKYPSAEMGEIVCLSNGRKQLENYKKYGSQKQEHSQQSIRRGIYLC
jgi:hypothetical protein